MVPGMTSIRRAWTSILVASVAGLVAPVTLRAAEDAGAKAKEVEGYILAKYQREQYYLKGMKDLDELVAYMEAKYHKAHRGGPNGTHAMWLFRPAGDPVGNCAFVDVYPNDPSRPNLLMFDRVMIGKCAMFEKNEKGIQAQ